MTLLLLGGQHAGGRRVADAVVPSAICARAALVPRAIRAFIIVRDAMTQQSWLTQES